MPAWEYKVVVRKCSELLSEEQINQYGAAGYELASTSFVSEVVMNLGRQEQRSQMHYFFKRAKMAAAPKPPPTAQA